ncbi:MAG: hypothetical protein AAF417_16025 [Pseudomonadota bacterium]
MVIRNGSGSSLVGASLGFQQVFSTTEVQRIAQSIASDFGGSTTESADSISVDLRKGPKRIRVNWPKHDLAEVWMAFYEGDQETGIYQDWFECMDNENKAEFVEYLRTIVARFFVNSSRVKRRGLVLRRSILEIETDSGWKDIFDPELDQ